MCHLRHGTTMKHPTNRFKHAFVVTALSLFISACTQHDPITGDVIPQGNQRYTFSEVKRRTANLIPGMSRRDVLIRLGSPAHRAGDDWVYLPERPGVILPAEALRVRFERGRYTNHAYEPIILGERLPMP